MKRILSAILVLSMIVSVLPASVITAAAADGYTITYDFNAHKTAEDGTVTSESIRATTYTATAGSWAWGGASSDSLTVRTHSRGVEAQTAEGGWFAVRIYIPAAGKYSASLVYGQSRTAGGEGDIYLLPGSVSDISAELSNGEKLNTEAVSYYNTSNKIGASLELNGVEITDEEVGEHILVFKATKNSTAEGYTSRAYMYPDSITLTSGSLAAPMYGAAATVDLLGMVPGETSEIFLSGYMSDGTLVSDCSNITYTSSAPDVISVAANGVVTANAEGDAVITVEVNGIKLSAETVSVREASDTRRSYYTDEKVKNARTNIGNHGWARTIRNTAVEKAEKYLALGHNGIWSTVTSQDLPRAQHLSAAFDDTGEKECLKCGETFTDTRPWAIDQTNHPWKIQCKACQTYFPSNDFESFYNLGLQADGTFDRQAALDAHHEKFASDVTLNSWENLTGLTEGSDRWYEYYGYGVEGGYLYNKTGLTGTDADGNDMSAATWAVDDGWGYSYTDTTATTQSRTKPFIAYYNYHGIWGAYDNAGGIIRDALQSLSAAYVYTGAPKYGIAGVILLDRIADVYPDFNVKKIGLKLKVADNGYNEGSEAHGVIFGKLADTEFLTEVVKAYDAFKPALAESEVTEFLSTKNSSKTSEDVIKNNIETNILRQAHTWRIKTREVDGDTIGTTKTVSDSEYAANFPLLPLMHILMGVVLDDETDSKTWIDYELTSFNEDGASGDNLLAQIVNLVDRDGHGSEAAPGYNGAWIINIREIADALNGYDGYDGADLYENPKFIRMLTSQIDILCTSDTAPNIGDHASMGRHISGYKNKLDALITAYGLIEDDETQKNIARAIYGEVDGAVSDLHGNIFDKPSELLTEAKILAAVEESQAPVLGSRNLTGYGLALLRDGNLTDSNDTQRDFYMWYGKTNVSHSHRDKLNLGFHAYGLDVGADVGEPANKTSDDPHRFEMMRQTVSHNTVTVNNISQRGVSYSIPLHFDVGERVQVMDVEAPEAYDFQDVEEYRRTLVMVDADDDISYGVDFFHVKGGEDHLYSFHALGTEADLLKADGTALEVTKQTDSSGNYIGSYQGETAGWGASNVNSIDTQNGYGVTESLDSTDGLGTYSWFGEVDRVNNPEAVDMFSMDWEIVNDEDVLYKPGKDNLHVRLTMLPSVGLNEITATSGRISQADAAPLKNVRFLFARRTGTNLDTLFTSVIEPYDTTRYIKSIENVDMSRADGVAFTTDEAKAVKVTLTNDRVDYIVYAKDNTVSYIVSDGEQSFEFCGFVGVISMENGKVTYTYLNDGTAIGNNDYIASEYTGEVTAFTTGLSTVNSIDITLDTPIAPANLKGRYVYVDNTGTSEDNAVYRIESAVAIEGGMRLYIGNTSLITSYKDATNLDGGYNYNIATGNSISIPVAYEQQEISDIFGEKTGYLRAVNTDGECELTLLAGIDGAAEYNAVGFEITALGIKENSREKDVYGKVTALDENKEKITLLPEQFLKNSKYIFAGVFSFGTDYSGYGLMYRPFAIDLEGNWLYGENSVLDDIFGNEESE